MPLSKSLRQPFRKNMLLVGSGWRAFFAPFDYQAALQSPAGGPNILDLERQGPFNTAPYASTDPRYNQLTNTAGDILPGWVDTGWIKEYKITNNTKVGQVRSGYRGAVRAQYRGEVGEQAGWKFNEFGRLQYKIATGCQMFNIIKSSGAASTVGPLSSSGTFTPVALGASGYIASGNVTGYTGKPTLYVPSGSGAAFPANSYIVCDIDYDPATSGVIGENGTTVFPDVVTDTDFIRKTSDFTARVVAVVVGAGADGTDALILEQPFIGGGSPISTAGQPPSNSKVQLITGWTTRNGASFIQEWSCLLVADSVDGAQSFIYYPHLSINTFPGMVDWNLENAGTTDETGMQLEATFEALAYDDPIDGETVVSYTGFYPNVRVQYTY